MAWFVAEDNVQLLPPVCCVFLWSLLPGGPAVPQGSGNVFREPFLHQSYSYPGSTLKETPEKNDNNVDTEY